MPITSSRVVRQHVQREGKTFVVLEHLDSIGRAYMQLLRDTNPSTLRTRLPTIIANFQARLKKRENLQFARPDRAWRKPFRYSN